MGPEESVKIMSGFDENLRNHFLKSCVYTPIDIADDQDDDDHDSNYDSNQGIRLQAGPLDSATHASSPALP